MSSLPSAPMLVLARSRCWWVVLAALAVSCEANTKREPEELQPPANAWLLGRWETGEKGFIYGVEFHENGTVTYDFSPSPAIHGTRQWDDSGRLELRPQPFLCPRNKPHPVGQLEVSFQPARGRDPNEYLIFSDGKDRELFMRLANNAETK